MWVERLLNSEKAISSAGLQSVVEQHGLFTKVDPFDLVPFLVPRLEIANMEDFFRWGR